ncbi:MAG: hypothetical protein ACM3KH_00885 [Thiobacillus sp.]
MKIANKKPNNTKRWIIVIICFVLIAAILLVGKPLLLNDGKTATEQNSKSNSTTPPKSKTPINIEPTNNKLPSGSVDANITYVRQEDGLLKIGTIIDYVTNDGSCVLTLSNGQNSIQKTVNITALPSSSACNGFEVPVIELSKGDWDITIDIQASSKTAQLTQKVTVN